MSPPQMRIVKLYGELGKQFGTIHRLAIKTPAEAVRALSVNFPGFEKHLIESGKQNVAYQVKVDGREIDEAELKYPMSREIHFTPVIQGAGSSTAKLIIGAVLIVAGIVITAYGGGAVGGPMINVGIGFMIGGVVQMLSPVPKAQEPAEDALHTPSYVFNGPVNTTAQGQPVPIGYGRLIVGGAVISAGIVIDDLSTVDPLFNPASVAFVK